MRGQPPRLSLERSSRPFPATTAELKHQAMRKMEQCSFRNVF
jgi:hypothetical protein